MARVLAADDSHDAVAPDDLAIAAQLLDRREYFHCGFLVLAISRETRSAHGLSRKA